MVGRFDWGGVLSPLCCPCVRPGFPGSDQQTVPSLCTATLETPNRTSIIDGKRLFAAACSARCKERIGTVHIPKGTLSAATRCAVTAVTPPSTSRVCACKADLSKTEETRKTPGDWRSVPYDDESCLYMHDDNPARGGSIPVCEPSFGIP